MRTQRLLSLSLVAFAASFAASSGSPASAQTIEAKAIGSFASPTWVGAPEGDDRIFVARKDGVIKILQDGVELPVNFLSIKTQVSTISERGLLGVAFHPNYKNNGFVYTNYSDTTGATVISRWTVKPNNPNRLEPTSEVILLTVAQPFANHNGGWLGFGPFDGYLYVAFGDGGSANDPGCNAQNPGSFLGKIIRIDVDGGSPYAVPADNPFVGTPGYLPEIWHLGLRNPWRCSFDRATGDMYIGDVGQDAREEIDFAPAGVGGLNFGWKVKEGTKCNSTLNCGGMAPGCTSTSYTDPIYEMSHSSGGPGSVTGGYVYRGCAIPALQGTYVFADFVDDTIRSFTYDAMSGTVNNFMDRTSELAPSSGTLRNVASFGEDGFGELLMLEHLTTGELFRIVPAGANAATNVARNGSGVNATCYTSVSQPILGNVWSATVDPTGVPNATAIAVIGRTGSTSGVFLAGGEALVDSASAKLFQILAPVGTGVVSLSAPVPCDPSLAGATAYSQAVVLGPTTWSLCNALDITLGYY